MSNSSTITTSVFTLTANAVPYQPIVNLSWPDISNETSYVIYYLAPGSSNYEPLDEVAANVTTRQYTVPTIEPTNSYSFVVVPYRGSDPIGESNEASVTVDGITSKPGTSSTAGSAFSHTFTHTVASGNVSSRTLTDIPSTLTFDSGTGTLSGVYPALGNYTLHYTVNFADGGSLTQTFHIRVRPPEGAPLVGSTLLTWTGTPGSNRDTPLDGAFTDPEAESAVRVSTTLGDMDFILFDTATPDTVANFMNYANADKYTDVVFHRSVANFVIQGGGFKSTGTGSSFTSMDLAPPVINEPGIANIRGTISMAKSGGDPNSATSQFFVSLNDNRSNLDYQNGGFTVFGRVAGNGMDVADAINKLPCATYNLFVDGNPAASTFKNFPINDTSAPATMDQTKLAKVLSVTPIPTISYSITGNTHPEVALASIESGQLHLAGLSVGQTTVTVTATDLDNNSTSQTVEVNLSDTYATWVSRNTFAGGQDAPGQDPDADGWNNLLEYAFLGDPALSNKTSLAVFPGISGVAPAARHMTLTFPVRKATSGLSYAVEANDLLSGKWTEIWKSADGFEHPQVLSAVDEADRTVVTIRDTVEFGAQSKRFLRTRVVQD